MRALLILLALVVPLSACAVRGGAADGPSGGYEPLRAYITPPDGFGPGFYVNRPAYVALFEVVPGRGTSMLYPSPGYGRMSGLTFGGIHSLHGIRGMNTETFLPAFGSFNGPRFIFLIASEEPLNLDRVGAYGMGLRSALGVSFASINAYSSMERLARIVVPDVNADNWTTDLYVFWPQVVSPHRRPGLVRLRCNGMEMYVDIRYLQYANSLVCSRDREGDRPVVPGDSASAGDSTIVVPRRREAVPQRRADELLRDRITESEHFGVERRPSVERRTGTRFADDDRARSSEPRIRSGRRTFSRPDDDDRARSRPSSRSEGSRASQPRVERTRPSSPPVARPGRRGAGGVSSPPRREAPPKKKSGGCNPCSQE